MVKHTKKPIKHTKKAHSTKNKELAKKKEPVESKTESNKKSESEKLSSSEKVNGTQKILWGISIFLILIIAVAAYNAKQNVDNNPTNNINNPTNNINNHIVLGGNSEKVKLDFYVMSQCPYGIQVEKGISPVLDKIGDYVDFNLNFIASDNQDGTFRSLHGQNEVDGDIVQLCAIKYNPKTYMDLVDCQNKNPQGIPNNWEQCAKDNNLAVDKIRNCYQGEEGKTLLKESIQKSEAIQASGSPTIYLNDEKYAGGRTENDFLRSICNAFKTDKPAACADIPEPAKVNILVLNDKRCKECDVTGLMGQLKGVFPGMVVSSKDYNDAEGKKLYDDLKITTLPAILFDDTVQKSENYANVQPYLEATGSYYNLRIGATHDPTKEICDNGVDDTGNGQIDCADLECKDTMVCREEKKNNLQVFIMSDCPYGKLAVKALKEVVDNFGESNIDYEVHYIASATGDGFNSLHGQYEVDEDIVQLCVKEHSSDKWMDYIYCRSDKGIKGIDWKTCANEVGVDSAAVETCVTGTEGKALLTEDIKIANGLAIGASPTWLANNKYQFSGNDANQVKASYCQYNPDTVGCENTLSASSGAVPTGACG